MHSLLQRSFHGECRLLLLGVRSTGKFKMARVCVGWFGRLVSGLLLCARTCVRYSMEACAPAEMRGRTTGA